jgi:hypothetical protein
MNDQLQEALVVATRKLNEFVAARTEIDKRRASIDARIIQWKQLVDSLRTVCADEDEDPSDVEISSLATKSGKQTVKFTDGVRMVLKENRGTILAAADIREGLLNLGFDFSKYSQPLTPIHNCLKRLEEQGEVKAERTPEGQLIGYIWISPIERALDAENSYYGATGEGIIQEWLRTPVKVDESLEAALKPFLDSAMRKEKKK